MSRHIESQRDQFPIRTAAHVPHQDLAECHRAHGTVHSSCGRIIPGWKLAVADTATQESRLADTTGWTHHVAVPPSPLAIQGARAYSSLKGFDDPHASDYTHIMQDPQRVARVGRHYDSLPVYSPEAVPHFLAMQKEINDQYDFLTRRMGINVQPVDYDPYANVQELMNDIHGNKTLKVLGSHVTGGHPIFGNADNDKFRAVHDFFGHAATGRDFDRHGEHATYLAHGKMFTPQALPALTTETLGQNSSLILNGHFGPNKIGTIPRELTARRTAADHGLGKPGAVPSDLTTPRFNERDRPWLPDNTRLFLPNEVNPKSESYARPSTTWYGTYHDDEPLPLDHPSVDIRPDRNHAVERQPYELHRGIQFYLGDSHFNAHSPVLGRLRRLLRGDAMESSGRHSFDDHENWSPLLEGMPSNEEASAARNSQGYHHPEIPHLVLEHLLHTQDTDLDNHRDSLGRHWSTSRDMANRFAKIFPNQQYFDHHKLSAVLSGNWKGVGEDPYRRNTDGDFDDEKEISLLPGAPIHLHQIHVFDPNTGNWVTHHLDGGVHRTAKGKTKKKKKVKAPKPPQYYRDWSGPRRMWFLTDEGLHHEPEDTFTTSNPKQLYQLLRTDNTFAQQYLEHLQQTHNRPALPATDAQGREFIGMLNRDFPDVMRLLGDL